MITTRSPLIVSSFSVIFIADSSAIATPLTQMLANNADPVAINNLFIPTHLPFFLHVFAGRFHDRMYIVTDRIFGRLDCRAPGLEDQG
ncbi:MAG: hypothetical protein PHW60_11210 [Kiritimatiellae bacterium]|nr:hypothetical protein [Kiritimatiellia bacterium]